MNPNDNIICHNKHIYDNESRSTIYKKSLQIELLQDMAMNTTDVQRSAHPVQAETISDDVKRSEEHLK